MTELDPHKIRQKLEPEFPIVPLRIADLFLTTAHFSSAISMLPKRVGIFLATHQSKIKSYQGHRDTIQVSDHFVHVLLPSVLGDGRRLWIQENVHVSCHLGAEFGLSVIDICDEPGDVWLTFLIEWG